jgi:hypothetical protein
VHHTEDAVTIVHRLRHDAHAENVGKLLETELFLLHLAVNTVDVFLPVLDRGLDVGFLQALLDRRLDGVEDFLAVADDFLTGAVERAVAHRVSRLDRQVEQLVAHFEDTEPIGDRRVYVHGLVRDAASLVGLHDFQRAHVMQAIGELDDDHANILHHRQHHLAEVFRLRLGLAAKVDLRQLADPVDQLGHFFAELLGDMFLGGGRIFDNVVQNRGDDAFAVHAHIGCPCAYRRGCAPPRPDG